MHAKDSHYLTIHHLALEVVNCVEHDLDDFRPKTLRQVDDDLPMLLVALSRPLVAAIGTRCPTMPFVPVNALTVPRMLAGSSQLEAWVLAALPTTMPTRIGSLANSIGASLARDG